MVKIVALKREHEVWLRQVAELLMAAFVEIDAWQTVADGLAEVEESFGEKRISLVAVDEDDNVVGWVGGIRQYDGHAWELHPLAVLPARQKQGIGRALVEALEQEVRQRGGITIYLGTDDETFMTSLSQVDLYPDVWTHVAHIQNLRGHAFEFYQKLGFVIVGVIPDANGLNKPDIIMAKRVNGRL
jgi:aminoglycoside 6'-N-acetyltransferase I